MKIILIVLACFGVRYLFKNIMIWSMLRSGGIFNLTYKTDIDGVCNYEKRISSTDKISDYIIGGEKITVIGSEQAHKLIENMAEIKFITQE